MVALFGLLSLGGLAVGYLALGGLGAGWDAVGGMAIGWHSAVGGAAVAYHIAVGGAAIAHDYAVGGTALAEFANTNQARELAKSETYQSWLDWYVNHRILCFAIIMAISLSPITLLRLIYKSKRG